MPAISHERAFLIYSSMAKPPPRTLYKLIWLTRFLPVDFNGPLLGCKETALRNKDIKVVVNALTVAIHRGGHRSPVLLPQAFFEPQAVYPESRERQVHLLPHERLFVLFVHRLLLQALDLP